MREIKFRAWDKRNKKILSWWDINDRYNFQSMIYSGAMNSDFYDVTQYTGLKDKNGTEIYEGDIVKTYNGDKGVVKSGEYQDEEILDYGEGYYIDCDGEERKTVGFFVEHLNGECAALDNRADKWIEVIGDIYDNPELLEVE